MEFKTLRNGNEIPVLGYGVYQIDNETTGDRVAEALKTGYRMIDTAQAYGNEQGVGAGIAQSGVERGDVYVVDKVWVSNYGKGTTYSSVEASLKKLDIDAIDMMLLHQPFGDFYAAWYDLERAYQDGLVKGIGVSNFDPVRLLDLCTFAEIKPMLNQVETNVFCQQKAAHTNMCALGVQHMAWSPFAEGMNDFFHNPLLGEIGENHNKTVGQVTLRYLIDSDVLVIPKSVRPERMAENFDVFDFELSSREREIISDMDTGNSVVFDHSDIPTVKNLLNRIKSMM